MSCPDGPILVLGVGNILLRDEGVGVLVVRELERRANAGEARLPSGTRVVDGGTLGLDLLPVIDEARALIMVDAVALRRGAGSVAVLRGGALHGALAGHVSPHQVGVGDLIAVGRLTGALPDAVALVGIEPGEIAIGLELTPAVAAAVDDAIEAIIAELDAITGPVRDRDPVPAGTG